MRVNSPTFSNARAISGEPAGLKLAYAEDSRTTVLQIFQDAAGLSSIDSHLRDTKIGRKWEHRTSHEGASKWENASVVRFRCLVRFLCGLGANRGG
jgi:hypothetical protein